MKKAISLILSLLMLLSLAACSTEHTSETNVSLSVETTSETSEETPADESDVYWHFEVQNEGTDGEYKADDGTVVMQTSYVLPRLAAVQSGETAVEGAEAPAWMLQVVDAFNAGSAAELERMIADADEAAADAKERYESMSEEERAYFAPYAEELAVSEVNSSDRMTSIVLNGWFNYGGAHPNAYNSVWNFDLEEGEFVGLADMTDDYDALRAVLAEEIIARIEAQDDRDVYFEDCADTLRAKEDYVVSFGGANEMTVWLGEDYIAPHAAGVQTFDFDLGMIAPYLNDYGAALLQRT